MSSDENPSSGEVIPLWISNHLSSVPQPLIPSYETEVPNTHIVLHNGPFSLVANGTQTFRGHGDIVLEWLPSPTVSYTLNIDAGQEGVLPNSENDVSLDLTFDAFPNTIEHTVVHAAALVGLQGTRLSRRFAHGFSHGDATNLTRVVFHVANCVQFLGSWVATPSQTEDGHPVTCNKGRCQFSACGWSVTIDRSRTAQQLCDAMNDEPGYGITHIGELVRGDGSSFTGSDAKDFLERLAYFLSFCSGRWCGSALMDGFESDGNKAWFDWHIARLDPWTDKQSWFPLMEESALPNLATGFFPRMAEPQLTKPMKVAISWYLDALSPGTIDTGTVLIQVCLELLAWTQLVHASKTCSKTAMEQLSCVKKIDKLLANAMVNPLIPDVFPELQQYAATLDLATGAKAIIKLRNALVHGSDVEEFLGVGGIARVQAWQLGTLYLELAILRLVDYTGEFRSRASANKWATAYEPVPWTATPSQSTTP